MDKLAFLNAKVRSLPLPPVKNILNVAMQTARQTMPAKPNKDDYTEPPHGTPPVPPRPQNVHFSDDVQQSQQPQRMEHHELNPFGAQSSTNPFNSGTERTDGQESTSFMGECDQGYQRSETYLNR